MKRLVPVGILLVTVTLTGAAEASVTNGAVGNALLRMYDQIYERLVNEKGTVTNTEMIKMPIAREAVVYKAFGLEWDGVPAPTVTGPEALAAVRAFVATNGWNMQTGGLLFTYGLDHPKPIRGLPWEAIRDVEFPALSHNGILYVILSGRHHDCGGVAYNPKTNVFPGAIKGFKHIGQHWYAWAQPEDQLFLTQQYEGQRLGEQGGSAAGGQPFNSGTNRQSGAAGPRR